MGAPVSALQSSEEKTAETLLSVFKHTAAAERRRHATVYNYWLSIRRDRELPPIRDLDPLEISDVAPSSVLIELIDAGDDAEIRHVGEALRDGVTVTKLRDAPVPSVLSCIAEKLGIIAISRDALSFEDHFLGADGTTRCSVTLLPFSTTGEAVDFVYGLVGIETGVTFAEETTEPEAGEESPGAEVEPVIESAAETEVETEVETEPSAIADPEPAEPAEGVADEPPLEVAAAETVAQEVAEEEKEGIPVPEPEPAAEAEAKPGFSKIFDALAGAKGFFGTMAAADQEPEPEPDPEEQPEPVAEEVAPVIEEPAVAEEPEIGETLAEEVVPVIEDAVELDNAADDTAAVAETEIPTPTIATEGSLQSKLVEVRSKADEARMAKLRAEAALIEGLSAAYDFALDAEDAPEEYLKLVEGQGLKIQLRSPMKPVVKLAFDGYCDGATIAQLEAVLAWALKADLPRGSLAERVEAEGGIDGVLSGSKRRASDG